MQNSIKELAVQVRDWWEPLAVATLGLFAFFTASVKTCWTARKTKLRVDVLEGAVFYTTDFELFLKHDKEISDAQLETNKQNFADIKRQLDTQAKIINDNHNCLVNMYLDNNRGNDGKPQDKVQETS